MEASEVVLPESFPFSKRSNSMKLALLEKVIFCFTNFASIFNLSAPGEAKLVEPKALSNILESSSEVTKLSFI